MREPEIRFREALEYRPRRPDQSGAFRLDDHSRCARMRNSPPTGDLPRNEVINDNQRTVPVIERGPQCACFAIVEFWEDWFGQRPPKKPELPAAQCAANRALARKPAPRKHFIANGLRDKSRSV